MKSRTVDVAAAARVAVVTDTVADIAMVMAAATVDVVAAARKRPALKTDLKAVPNLACAPRNADLDNTSRY